MILTHGANSLERGGGDFVKIGGRKYKTVKIGSQIWMAENLDFKFSGVDIGPAGSPSTPAAWYYNNDEATYGIDGIRKCGLLYNWHAVKLLNDNKATLIPGWHVPSTTEWDDLASAVGGASVCGRVLKAIDSSAGGSWPSGWNGTDDYGFTIFPAGRYNDANFYDLDIYSYFWTADERSSTESYRKYFDTNNSMISWYYRKTDGYSLRLVKD